MSDARSARSAAVDGLADFYRYLADAEFDGYCALYAGIARSVATDDEVLERVVRMAAATKVLPILVFASVHYLLLGEPDLELAAIYRGAPGDPWPAFRSLVLDRTDELTELTRTRSVQTNEVGRSAILVPALSAAHQQVTRPLALIEIGTSAGLNLFFDRYHCTYDDGVDVGPVDSSVQLRTEVRGPHRPPRGARPIPIDSRSGIDLNPLDVTDDDACRWLEACIWPLVPDRANRLRAALAVARTEPPLIVAGDAMGCLEPAIEQLGDDVVPCVLATWVLAYFSNESRHALHELLGTIGERRDLMLITSEYPGITPWIPRPTSESTGASDEAGSLLGLVTWIDGVERNIALGWTHAHGRWIEWIDEATADPVR